MTGKLFALLQLLAVARCKVIGLQAYVANSHNQVYTAQPITKKHNDLRPPWLFSYWPVLIYTHLKRPVPHLNLSWPHFRTTLHSKHLV